MGWYVIEVASGYVFVDGLPTREAARAWWSAFKRTREDLFAAPGRRGAGSPAGPYHASRVAYRRHA